MADEQNGGGPAAGLPGEPGDLPAGRRVRTADGLAGVITGRAADQGYWVDLGPAAPQAGRYWNARLWSWLYQREELRTDEPPTERSVA